MNTILNEQEEKELRDHFALKVRPRYATRTVDKIVEAVNKIRTGLMKETEFVNPVTKIADWQTYLEVWGLYNRFVRLE